VDFKLLSVKFSLFHIAETYVLNIKTAKKSINTLKINFFFTERYLFLKNRRLFIKTESDRMEIQEI